MAGKETERDRPIPVVLERDEGPHSAYYYWASLDPTRLAERLSEGRVDRAAAGFGEIPETDEGDPRPLGWPSALSAPEALRSLATSLRWWGVARGPEDLKIVRGRELFAADAFLPEPVPASPSGATGQAFVAANTGAAVLDAVSPGWQERVDSDLVDQRTDRRNVLALAFGSTEEGRRLLEAATSRHGETHPDDLTLLGLSPEDLWVDKDQRELAAECLNGRNVLTIAVTRAESYDPLYVIEQATRQALPNGSPANTPTPTTRRP